MFLQMKKKSNEEVFLQKRIYYDHIKTTLDRTNYMFLQRKRVQVESVRFQLK